VTAQFKETADAYEFAGRRKKFRVDRIYSGVMAGLDALPFASGSFDFVVARRPFSQGVDPRRLLAEVSRVLRPEGRFAFLQDLPARRSRLWPEIDMETLAEPLGRKVVAAEEALYASGEIPFSLNEELLSSFLKEAGFHVAAFDLRWGEEELILTEAFFERLFKPAPPAAPLSYGDRLRSVLSAEEFEAVRELIVSRLKGRRLKRATLSALVVAFREKSET